MHEYVVQAYIKSDASDCPSYEKKHRKQRLIYKADTKRTIDYWKIFSH